MTSRDLMIGDLVCTKDENRINILRILGIEAGGSTHIATVHYLSWADCASACDVIQIAYLDPIPLTPEILEKNGWVLDEIDGSYRNYDNHFWIGGRNAPFGIEISNIYTELNYVQELQHALRLCGIDKEIVL